MRTKILAAALAATLPFAAQAANPTVDPDLPTYEKTSGISGNLTAVGSDTLNNLMTLWAEQFRRHYPNVRIQVEGKGSSTAPPALIEGTAQLGPMSRAMKAQEIDAFEKKFGYEPTQIKVALDALAVFVHKNNPTECLSLSELEGIFSSTRPTGAEERTRWENGRPISLYGRNSASGTYGYFKDVALEGGDYKASVKEQPGSAAVVQAVSSDPSGIGYSGMGYMTSGVKTVALSKKDGGECVAPTMENVYAGTYPLGRFLYVYVNQAPGKPLDPLTREFLKLVLSKQGQQGVVKDGYLPLPAKVAKGELSNITR